MSVAEEASSSTRVFISGLPPSLTSKQLRDHFSQKFEVTDAHVCPDRRIAFVGLTDHESARKASSYFNKSFIRMSKISVELARPFDLKKDGKGQATPVSKRTLDARQGELQQAKKRKRTAKDDGEHLHGTEDDSDHASKPQINGEPQDVATQAGTPSVEISTTPRQASEQGQLNDSEDVPTSAANDADWLRGKTSRILDLVEPAEESVEQVRAPKDESEEDDDEDAIPTPPNKLSEEKPEPPNAEPQLPEIQNGRLFLRNLPFSTTEDDLTTLFSSFGNIEEVHLVKDKRTSVSKGTAFVQFFDPPDAGRALFELDGKPFQGRLLHILPASNRQDTKLTEYEISKLPLKKQKALKQKVEASSASFSWNTLYMNPDAVMASVASRLGVSKSELLDPSSADAAVKQAQAETSIIQETKSYLEIQGLDIDAFKNRARDDRSLLLKNFSFGTTSEELSSMLSEYGKVDKIVFPPTGTMAIVRFEESFSSQAALKGLAYKNLKGSVLYLDKAPSGLFEKKAPHPQSASDQSRHAEEVKSDQSPSRTTSTVFVRNINFATTSARLAEVFKPLSGFLSARVKTRTDAARPGEVLSMGFGFVEFQSKKQAEAAVATMNKHRLDGHEILVQPSQKSLDAAEERRKEDIVKKGDQQKTKLVIKNLPFEASKKDIKTLLGGYGTLRSVRMPKKFDRSARGFAFADFVTAKEARTAMEALSNTHLLGRRLVFDFAEGDIEDPEEAIKAMEKKAGHQIHLNAVNKMMTGSSRKKFNADAREDGEPVAR